MMLSELDLKLFTLLDEFVDKELKVWCYVYVWEKIAICTRFWCDNSEYWGWHYWYSFIQESWRTLFDSFAKENYEIIWQIHLGTILLWFWTKLFHYKTYWIDIIEIYSDIKNIKIRLDISKTPLERSDEQKQEFIGFAEKIK